MENTDFLSSFDLLLETELDENQRERLNLYALKINANEFNYSYLQDVLVDPVLIMHCPEKLKENIRGSREPCLKKQERNLGILEQMMEN